MVVLTLTVRLHAPWCRSLKDKRSESKCSVPAAGEIQPVRRRGGEQDSITLIEMGVAAIAASSAQADSIAETWPASSIKHRGEILSVEKELR